MQMYDTVTYNGPSKKTNTGRHTIHTGDVCIVYGLSGNNAVIKESGTCDGYEGTIRVPLDQLTFRSHRRR